MKDAWTIERLLLSRLRVVLANAGDREVRQLNLVPVGEALDDMTPEARGDFCAHTFADAVAEGEHNLAGLIVTIATTWPTMP